MMKLKPLASLLFIFLIFSCSNDDDVLPQTCTDDSESFYNLKLGSYWVYEWYKIDPMGNESMYTDNPDTIMIIGDTMINGKQYAIQNRDFLSFQYTDFIRDSLGYLINSEGRILFSTNNFNEILDTDTIGPTNSILFTVSYQMESPDLTAINAPAGTFNCLNLQGTYKNENANVAWDTRMTDSHFAKGIGNIKLTTFFSSSLNTLERRLVEYKLN